MTRRSATRYTAAGSQRIRSSRACELREALLLRNGIAIFSKAFPAGDHMPHGKICYLEIPANTAEASAEFYGRIFGWKVRRRGDGELAFDDPGGVSGTWVKDSDRTPEERTRTYIMVDAIADTLKQIEAAGGRVLTPRTVIGSGMGAFAVFADPVGNEFGLYEEPSR